MRIKFLLLLLSACSLSAGLKAQGTLVIKSGEGSVATEKIASDAATRDQKFTHVYFEDATYIGRVANINSTGSAFFDSMESIGDELKWNDIAYYMEKQGYYQLAIDLLSEIIDENPGRVVAYLNISDCYAHKKEYDVASQFARRYIYLMKSKEHDINRIPERVWKRATTR